MKYAAIVFALLMLFACVAGAEGASITTAVSTTTPTIEAPSAGAITSGIAGGFSYAYWQCYDGAEQKQGSETSCKSSETWRRYAEEFCENHCYSDGSKCGVNSFSVTRECYSGGTTGSTTIVAVPEIVVKEATAVEGPAIARRACMPVCDAIGSRSEGYYDSCTGELIMWFKCAESKPACRGEGGRSEGWYDTATGELIKYADCYVPETTTIEDPQAVGCVCMALYAPVCSEDAVTYSNKCIAGCLGVKIAYEGKCRGEVACEYYEDERGCKITKCTDGSSKIDCPGQYEPECKKYFDEQGCVVRECTDGTREVLCSEPVAGGCKKYEDEKGCTVVECDGEVKSRECPIAVTPVPIATPVPVVEEECKYYFDEKGCKVRACKDGTTEVRCPTITVTVGPVMPLDQEPAPECKKIEAEDGCIKKVCDNGYETVYCPEVAEEIVAVECKVYIDGEGCRVQSCADGSEHRSCPLQEGTCTVYEEENGCKTHVCEGGKKYEECPAMGVTVMPEKPIAMVTVGAVSGGMAPVETHVDVESVAIRTPVATQAGGTAEVEISKEGGKVRIKAKNAVATTSHEVRVEQNRLRVAEKLVSILPDKALENVSEVAAKMEVRSIEINAEQERARYEVAGIEKGNLLFVIPVEMEVTATVNAESGEVGNVARPWWGFLVWG